MRQPQFFWLLCATISLACTSPDSDADDAAESATWLTLAEFRQSAEVEGVLDQCPELATEFPNPVPYALPLSAGSILLPDSTVDRAEPGGPVREWELPSGAAISAWVSEEPEMGLAATGGVRIEQDGQCALEIGAAFAHAMLYRIIAGERPDTSFAAMISAYPRPGLAILFDIEAPTPEDRGALLSSVRRAQIATSTSDPS